MIVDVGLAVGFSIGLFFFFVFIVIPVFIAVGLFSVSKTRARRAETHEATPDTDLDKIELFTVPSQQPPPQPLPAQYPQKQNNMYNDAEFNAPPSYDAAIAQVN